MAANVYECMFIFEPAKFARDSAGVTKEVGDAVSAAGGEMLVSRLWDDRRLAYPIKGHRKGPYWLSYFRLDSQQLTALNRTFRISDSVLRHLILKIDERIADAVVSHAATSGRKAPPAPGERPRRSFEEDDSETDDAAAETVDSAGGDADSGE